MLSPGLIIIWPGTNATIPSGFTRETTLDGKYPKGAAAATNPNTTGGAATHTHTSPSHTHSLASHTHTYTLTSNNTTSDNTNSTSDAQLLVGQHSHTGTTTSMSGGDTLGTAVTYGAVSNDPPYLEVIFIKASGYQAIPDDAVLFLNGDTIPSGFANYSDLNGKYAKGAAAGQDSGTTGGSTTNEHDISHGHTAQSHTHSGLSGNESPSNRRDRNIASPANGVGNSHKHTVTLTSATIPIDSYSGSLTTAETVEPAYTKLRPIQNTSGNSKLPQQKMIAMYLGSLSTIPAGWKLCDGNNDTVDMQGRYVKTSTTDTETGDTGGANTHTHASQSHTHTTTSASHSHPGSGSVSAHVKADQRVGNGVAPNDPDSNHSVSSTGTTSASYGSANTTANSSSNEPSYRTVLFLEFEFMIGAAGLIALL